MGGRLCRSGQKRAGTAPLCLGLAVQGEEPERAHAAVQLPHQWLSVQPRGMETGISPPPFFIKRSTWQPQSACQRVCLAASLLSIRAPGLPWHSPLLARAACCPTPACSKPGRWSQTYPGSICCCRSCSFRRRCYTQSEAPRQLVGGFMPTASRGMISWLHGRASVMLSLLSCLQNSTPALPDTHTQPV